MSYIIKADVSGSAEAVAASIEGLGNSEVSATVLYKGVGPVNDTDLARAETAKAQILTFNLNADRDIRSKAERKQVGTISHSIIYRLLEDVTAQLASQLQPEIKQKVLGEAVVREIFDFTVKSKKSAKKISIAGSRVTNGHLSKKSLVRVLRNKKRLSSVVTFPLLNISKRRSRKSKRTLTVASPLRAGLTSDPVMLFDLTKKIRSPLSVIPQPIYSSETERV